MNAWMLRVCGVGLVFAAIGLGAAKATVDHRHADPREGRGKWTRTGGLGFAITEKAPPRKRSERSRRTDVSMATRMKREVVVVHVGGFVRSPGPIRIMRSRNLRDAIQAAGGANEFGSMKRVRLTREGRMRVYDLSKPDFVPCELQDQDTVEVPQKVVYGL